MFYKWYFIQPQPKLKRLIFLIQEFLKMNSFQKHKIMLLEYQDLDIIGKNSSVQNLRNWGHGRKNDPATSVTLII